MNMFGITTEIRGILLASASIKDGIGQKIYPIVAPDGTDGDFIVYQRDGYRQEYSKMGVARQIPIVYVSVISDNYDRSNKIASLIYSELEGSFKNPTMTIHLEDSTEDYVDNKYVQVLQFSISSL
jgi:hypothetical protein